MSAYFFDSSAIVKRYVEELGSDWVEATLTTGSQVYVAAITGVEVIAAFARKLKGNHLSMIDAGTAISNFHNDFANQYVKAQLPPPPDPNYCCNTQLLQVGCPG